MKTSTLVDPAVKAIVFQSKYALVVYAFMIYLYGPIVSLIGLEVPALSDLIDTTLIISWSSLNAQIALGVSFASVIFLALGLFVPVPIARKSFFSSYFAVSRSASLFLLILAFAYLLVIAALGSGSLGIATKIYTSQGSLKLIYDLRVVAFIVFALSSAPYANNRLYLSLISGLVFLSFFLGTRTLSIELIVIAAFPLICLKSRIRNSFYSKFLTIPFVFLVGNTISNLMLLARLNKPLDSVSLHQLYGSFEYSSFAFSLLLSHIDHYIDLSIPTFIDAFNLLVPLQGIRDFFDIQPIGLYWTGMIGYASNKHYFGGTSLISESILNLGILFAPLLFLSLGYFVNLFSRHFELYISLLKSRYCHGQKYIFPLSGLYPSVLVCAFVVLRNPFAHFAKNIVYYIVIFYLFAFLFGIIFANEGQRRQ